MKYRILHLALMALLLALVALLPTPARAQVAFHDALALNAFVYFDADAGAFRLDLSGANKDAVFALLKRYTDGTPTSANEVYTAYVDAGNSFITDFFSDVVSLGEEALAPETAAGPSAAGLVSALGGLNVTSLADGLAQFLVDRARAELSITFFRQFKETLERQQALRDLFPQTYDLFLVIEDQIYHYAYFLQALKAAFEKDLGTLPAHLDASLRQADGKALQNPTVQSLAAVAFLSADLVRGVHPAEVLNTVATSGFLKTPSGNLENALSLQDLLARSLLDETDDRMWVAPAALKPLLDDPQALKLYAGLLYQSGGALRFTRKDGSAITFRAALLDVKANLKPFRTYLDTFVGFGALIHTRLALIREKKRKGEVSFEDYFDFLQVALEQLADGLNRRAGLPMLDSLAAGEDIRSLLTLVGHANNLVLDLRQKRYGTAVVEAAAILEAVIRQDSLKPYRRQLLKYGTFMATVAQAETAGDVKKAIEAVALPVGSASIKKYAIWSVSLNAYLGAFAADERLRSVDTNRKLFSGLFSERRNLIYGMTAPVGFALSYGFHRKDYGALSLFISLIDVGAVTAYRFEDDSTEALPEIRLENLFAPGVHLVYGFPKWPVSVGFGVQMGPGLRKVTATTLGVDGTAGFRTGFFIAVDIPLLTFYSGSRN